jgi:hypothetical protein
MCFGPAVCGCVRVCSNGQCNAPPGRFVTLVAGARHACALLMTDLNVVCWGANDYGQAPETPISGPFASLSAGQNYVCGVRYSDGTLACWGWDISGAQFAPVGAFVAVAAGTSMACAVRRTDFTMTCWGSDRCVRVARRHAIDLEANACLASAGCIRCS